MDNLTYKHARSNVSKAQSITQKERDYLRMGINQPGGKLPLFDGQGQEINLSVIKACVNKGLAEQWFCLLYTSPSPRDATLSRMPSSA